MRPDELTCETVKPKDGSDVGLTDENTFGDGELGGVQPAQGRVRQSLSHRCQGSGRNRLPCLWIEGEKPQLACLLGQDVQLASQRQRCGEEVAAVRFFLALGVAKLPHQFAGVEIVRLQPIVVESILQLSRQLWPGPNERR